MSRQAINYSVNIKNIIITVIIQEYLAVRRFQSVK